MHQAVDKPTKVQQGVQKFTHPYKEEELTHAPKRTGFPIPAKVESLPLHQGEDKLTHPSKKEELTNALERKSPPIPPRRESHPVHPGADKPTKVQQEGRSLPMR